MTIASATLETLLIATLALPLAAAVLIALLGQRPLLRETVTVASALGLFALVATLAAQGEAAFEWSVHLAEPVPGIGLALSIEPLGLLFALVASALWVVTSIYAIGYIRSHGVAHQTRFFIAFAISIAATMGVAFADNLLTLFIFYEILTVATYPLVTHVGGPLVRRAGRLYLGLLMGTSIALFLPAIVWTYALAGTVDFAPGGILPETISPLTANVLLVLFVLGIGKAALMPFHRWLPAAMVAPTPVSALLHAVAVVKAGVFTILQIATMVFGLDLIATLDAALALAYLAGFTVLAASLIAMTKDNLKARLAYSTVSQLGYIVLGAMLGVAAGATGAAMHIATHAVGKITLFFCAGAIMVTAHKAEISEMGGLGRRMPITIGAFLVASISIIGLPPTAGTWSKWFLVQGSVEAALWPLVAVLLISPLLNIAYLLPIPLRAFFGAPPAAHPHHTHEGTIPAGTLQLGGLREAPLACLIPLSLTAIACVVLFFAAQPLYELATGVAGAVD